MSTPRTSVPGEGWGPRLVPTGIRTGGRPEAPPRWSRWALLATPAVVGTAGLILWAGPTRVAGALSGGRPLWLALAALVAICLQAVRCWGADRPRSGGPGISDRLPAPAEVLPLLLRVAPGRAHAWPAPGGGGPVAAAARGAGLHLLQWALAAGIVVAVGVPAWPWLRWVILGTGSSLGLAAAVGSQWRPRGAWPWSLHRWSLWWRMVSELRGLRRGAALLARRPRGPARVGQVGVGIVLGATVLWLAGRAVGPGHIGGGQVAVAYALGLLVALALPLPSDLGTYEIPAALALVGSGVAPYRAVAMVIAFRLLLAAAGPVGPALLGGRARRPVRVTVLAPPPPSAPRRPPLAGRPGGR